MGSFGNNFVGSFEQPTSRKTPTYVQSKAKIFIAIRFDVIHALNAQRPALSPHPLPYFQTPRSENASMRLLMRFVGSTSFSSAMYLMIAFLTNLNASS